MENFLKVFMIGLVRQKISNKITWKNKGHNCFCGIEILHASIGSLVTTPSKKVYFVKLKRYHVQKETNHACAVEITYNDVSWDGLWK